MLEPILYRDGDIALTGWLARPVGTSRAAVVVFPTIMNITPAVMAKTDALSNAGYLAFVADFYGEAVRDFTHAGELAKALRADVDGYRRRLRAALTTMASLDGAAGLPAMGIGFCMGGQAVLELARDGANLRAVVGFHGLLDTARPASAPIIPRLLICHGDADRLVPREQVLAFWNEMDAVGANWHFHAYSGVEHGFTNPNPPPTGGPITYNASADRQSWAAMLELFGEVFDARRDG